jgi:hypothetical protein
VRRNWTSVPYGDEWWNPGRQIISFFHGTFQFADLFQQHNESRKLFPNVYYSGLVAVTSQWDVKHAMVLTGALACLESVLLFVVSRRTTTFSFLGRLSAPPNFLFFRPSWLLRLELLWQLRLDMQSQLSFYIGVGSLAVSCYKVWVINSRPMDLRLVFARA